MSLSPFWEPNHFRANTAQGFHVPPVGCIHPVATFFEHGGAWMRTVRCGECGSIREQRDEGEPSRYGYVRTEPATETAATDPEVEAVQ